MRFFRAPHLPLGVDVAEDAVSVVGGRAVRASFIAEHAASLDLPLGDTVPRDVAAAESLRQAVRQAKTAERRCVLAIPPADVATRIFRVPAGMGRAESRRAAFLEGAALVDWPRSERSVAVMPLEGRRRELLIAVARTSSADRLARIALAAGLTPIAMDLAACAWRRAAREADAVLDCSNERAQLTLFSQPIGHTQIFAPRLVDDRLAAHVRASFAQARRDGIADVRLLCVVATPYRFEALEQLLAGDGYAIVSLVLRNEQAPRWAFAYGLASWAMPHARASAV